MYIKTELNPVQISGASWLQEREGSQGCKGGMFCDDPGMGKTLTLLKLICTHHPDSTTLVVAPSNVIDVWKQEIAKHTTIPPQNIFVYHGQKRSRVVNALRSHVGQGPKLVLTSYGIVRNECLVFDPDIVPTSILQEADVVDSVGDKKAGEPDSFISTSIFNIPFYRVILDEAHFIKDRANLASLSVIRLKAVCKWVVTATALCNHLDEDFSYFRFLGIIWNFKHWRNIMPATKDSLSAINVHQLALGIDQIKEWKSKLYLKRDKTQLNLPAKHEMVLYVQQSPVEKEFYDALYKYSMYRINQLQHSIQNKKLKDYGRFLGKNVLILILRLRQACLNPWFVIKNMKRLQPSVIDANGAKAKDKVSIESAIKMLNFFNENKGKADECATCMDTTANSMAKPCGHKLCSDCWFEISKKSELCPFCRQKVIQITNIADVPDNINVDYLFTESEYKEQEDTDLLEQDKYNVSCKMQKAMEIVESKISSTKLILVSQWITMLDYVQDTLEQAGYSNKPGYKAKIVRIDGKVPLEKRAMIIKQFQEDPETRICLISLTCSAEGITLTSATVMIFFDQWWNELGKPEQMSNRIHRIGQKNETEVIHLRIKNSIEDKIASVHNRKNNIISLSLPDSDHHTMELINEEINELLLNKPKLLSCDSDEPDSL